MSTFPETLRAAQAGEPDALAALWRAENAGLVRFLRARAPQVAEDVASETWIKVAGHLGRFHGEAIDFRAWLFTIARRTLIDWQRRDARRPAVAVGVEVLEGRAAPDDPAQTALAAMGTEQALALVGRLASDQAEVVLLRVVAGLDVARVARIVGKREGTVRVLAHRGLRRLAAMLGEVEEGGEGPVQEEAREGRSVTRREGTPFLSPRWDPTT